MVQAGTLPSSQLPRRAATPLLTAAQPCPAPADVKTFQLREVRESKEEGPGSPAAMMTVLLPWSPLPVVILSPSRASLQAAETRTENNDANHHNTNKHNMALVQYEQKTGTGQHTEPLNFSPSSP